MSKNRIQRSGTRAQKMSARRPRGRKPRRGAAAGKSSIHEFATCDSAAPLLQCIHNGAEVNAVDEDGITPLVHALLSGRLNNVLALLEYGAEVNGCYVLTYPVIENKSAGRYRTDVRMLYISHGMALETARIPVTPLHLACMRGDLRLIYALLANGADPQAEVQGPLPEFCGKPADFYARFEGGYYPADFLSNRESTVDFLADCVAEVDESVFRIYLHKTGVLNVSSRATCISQVRGCAALAEMDLFGNAVIDSQLLRERILRGCPDFLSVQKGGMARSLNRFLEYAVSSTRKKYNSLECLVDA